MFKAIKNLININSLTDTVNHFYNKFDDVFRMIGRVKADVKQLKADIETIKGALNK